MASNSEKTHAKNAENTHIANTIVAEVGTIFNPTNPLIGAPALVTFEATLVARNQAVNAAIPAEQNAVGEQIAAFKLVSKRVSKIMKAAKAQGLDAEFLGHLQSTAYRLNGVRVNKATPDKPETPADESKANHSVSRRSYAGILESLDLLDEQIKSNPNWETNEVEYQSATITAWVESLRNLHNTALETKIATRTARNNRDSFAYNPTDGLLVRMNALKPYLETILDKNDPRLKQIKKLRFVDYSK